jgi:hypothetical protein
MSIQNRTYVTLSPRMRKALELCATFDGSAPASYAAMLLSSALTAEIERHPALRERWVELEREALQAGSWDALSLPGGARKDEAAAAHRMQGWLLAGDNPKDYEYGVDAEQAYPGKSSGYLRSRTTEAQGFGTLMQMFKAGEYRNKRLRFSAMVKAEDVEDWAGLWMRIDGPKGEMLGFDNMQHRPIQGTTDWQSYSVVLDVPEESVDVAFGVLLQGAGQVWINDIQLTEIGDDVPVTTEQSLLDKPTNLDFGV